MSFIQKLLCLFLSLLSVPVLAQCDFTTIVVNTETANYGPEVGWEIVNTNGIVQYTFSADADFSSYTDEVCLPDGCYIFTATDTYGDGWNGGTATISVNGVTTDIELSDGFEGSTPFGVNATGCTLDAPCTNTEVFIETTTVAYGSEVSWEIQDSDGNLYYTFEATEDNSTYEDSPCLADGCYIFLAMDSYGDGWNGGSVQIDIDGTFIDYALADGYQEGIAFGVNANGCEVIILGCTDPDALNYDPAATEDDGSCETIADYLAIQNITPLIQSGPIHNRINWGIQNRGTTNPNDEFPSEEVFIQMLEDSLISCFTIGDDLEKEPYARYRAFFNIDAWWWENAPAEGEGWSWDILKGIRDAYYLPWEDDEHGWATLFSTTRYGGGGGAGVQPETRTGDGFMFGVGYQTLLHEFGHTMPQVPDEYTASGEWSGGNCWESANATAYTIRDSIPWRKWIDPQTPLPTPYTGEYENTIGAFEGALTNYFGCHRPTAKGCYMGAGGFGDGFGQDMCAPCRQRVVSLLYKYVDVIENPMPAQTAIEIDGPQTLSFSADVVKPEPNTQTYTWLLNGNPIAEGTEEVEVSFGMCDDYTLTLLVVDTTSWVRYDEKFDHFYPKPQESHTWIIDQTATDGSSLSATATPDNLSCNGSNDGEVSLEGSGGMAPYTAFFNGLEVGNEHTSLTVGEYTYWVVDAEGCGVEVTATVNQDPLLEVGICTQFSEDWGAEANIYNYDPETLTIEWSNGDTGILAENLGQGSHEVEVTTVDGCSISVPFTLGPAPGPISVSETTINSGGESPSGAVYLSISGGSPAFTIDWYDKLARDLTFGSPDNASASGTNFGHLPEMAFDDDDNTKWLQMGEADLWVRFGFEEEEMITHYTLMSGDDVEERDPQDWMLQGLDAQDEWVTIDTRTGIDFPERKQVKMFSIDTPGIYSAYRLFITANSGADAIQLQELELLGASSEDPFVFNAAVQDQLSRTGLAPGEYRYEVRDQYAQCAINEVGVETENDFTTAISVVQESTCSVMIESPNPDYTYYWLSDESGSDLLEEGTSFAPPNAGNYWVAAVDNATGVMSSYRPGFAVTMPAQPQIEETSEGVLEVTNADPNLIYRWYDMACEGTLISEGNTYAPGDEYVELYVAAWWAQPFPDPIDPTSVDGLLTRMDAADIDGDGEIENPSLPTSSLYDWNFEPGSGISDGGWFAYRGNNQNGLGIADFATMWLQCANAPVNNYRTVIMAYEENLLSWEGSAPFFGMDNRMPYSATPGVSLYSNDVPQSTLNGITVLNGQEVDPMDTPNPMTFCTLAQTFTDPAGNTDCTDTHWEGKVGEILFYQDALSSEQLIGISEYLRRKWISTADLESIRTYVEWDGEGIGIDDPLTSESGAFSIYPNPSDGRCILQRSDAASSQQWSVWNSQGSLLAQGIFTAGAETMDISHALTSTSAGVYYIRLSGDTGKFDTVRFIKY